MISTTISLREAEWEKESEVTREVRLLRSAREGNAAAAEELFLNYLKGSRSIGCLLRKALANPADREEMLHEIYMALVSTSNLFRGESRLSTYVYRVARITIFQKYRRENTMKRRQLLQTLTEALEPGDNGRSSPEAAYMLEQNHQLVERMIQELPGAYQEALRLRVQKDLSYEEIAAQMHLPINTVSTRIHKGKKLLAALHGSRKLSECQERQGL